MPTCSFCKKNYSEHKGITVFTFDGRTVYFCSSKCKRNADLKRDPKKINWIKKKKKTGDARKKKIVVSEEKVIKKSKKPKTEEDGKETPKKEVKEEVVDEDDE